jgi:hypothetical protein
MRVRIQYQTPQYSWYNDAFLGYKNSENVVSIDDGGKELGEFIVGILQASAQIRKISLAGDEDNK